MSIAAKDTNPKSVERWRRITDFDADPLELARMLEEREKKASSQQEVA
jgi:hypothetical protein